MKSEIITNQIGKFRRRYNCMIGKYELLPIEPKQDKPRAEDVDRWYVAYLENQMQLLATENQQLRSDLFLLQVIHNGARQLITSLNGQDTADIL